MPDTLTIVADTLRTMMGATAAEPYVLAILKAVAEALNAEPATPSAAFLTRLTEHARRYGHAGDYVAVEDFVRAVYREEGVEAPDLTPYPPDDES